MTTTSPLASPPKTEKPPYTDGRTTIYRSARFETSMIDPPTSRYTFRPPLGSIAVATKPVESAFTATGIRTAATFANMTGRGGQNIDQPTAVTALDGLPDAVRNEYVQNDDVRTCDRADDATLTENGIEKRRLTISQTETNIMACMAGDLEVFTDITPCGGPKTAPRDMIHPSTTLLQPKATARSTEQNVSASGSAPGPATTSITHTHSPPRGTSLPDTSTDIGTQRPLTIAPPLLHVLPDAPIPTPALLTHLRLHHQETASSPATQSALPAIALLTLTLTLVFTISTLLCPSPQRLPSCPRTPPISGLRLRLPLFTTILTILFPLTALSAALPTNTALPQHPSTTTLLPRTNPTPTNPPDTTPPVTSPLQNLSPPAAAAIWAVTAFALLLALAVLLWFCCVRACWARWSERRGRERVERERRWWLR